MREMLVERRLKFLEQLFRHRGRMPLALKKSDQLFLPPHMALPEGDVIVHHFEIGGAEGHGAR